MLCAFYICKYIYDKWYIAMFFVNICLEKVNMRFLSTCHLIFVNVYDLSWLHPCFICFFMTHINCNLYESRIYFSSNSSNNSGWLVDDHSFMIYLFKSTSFCSVCLSLLAFSIYPNKVSMLRDHQQIGNFCHT